jgi:hypothetical protein
MVVVQGYNVVTVICFAVVISLYLEDMIIATALQLKETNAGLMSNVKRKDTVMEYAILQKLLVNFAATMMNVERV